MLSTLSMVIKQALIGNLSGGFAAAISHVKVGDCAHAIGGITNGVQGLIQAKSQGANHPSCHYCDASRIIYYVQSVKSRHLHAYPPAIFDCFPIRSTLHNDPERRKQQLGSPPIVSWNSFSGDLIFKSGSNVLAAFSRLDSMATKLYVGNLPFNTTENELQELFSQAGAVQEVMLMQDKFTGKSRGFAFVTMGSEQDAQKAIAEINGKTLEGRALTVNEARPRESRPPGGGGGGYGGDRRRDGGQRRGR
jgi:hypothetical protein